MPVSMSRSPSDGAHCVAGQQTLVGITLNNLQQGQSAVSGGTIYAMGDGNQEDTDNLSPLNWQPLQGCYHFELNEEPVSGLLACNC